MTASLRRLLRDRSGTSIVEFAILAPVIFGLFLGVLQIGLQMFSYNAIRSITADTARYTIVEYQKRDLLAAEQVASKAVAIAVNPPYSLVIDNLTANVTTPTTDITGTKKFQIVLTYIPPNPLGFLNINAPTLTATRVVYVQP